VKLLVPLGAVALFVGGILLAKGTGQSNPGIETISLPVTEEITRADFHVYRGAQHPQAVLVLLPGLNGDAKQLVAEESWQKFAREHQLLLVGASFESPPVLEGDRRGYYYAERESGEMLLKAVKEAAGQDLPILLYGFSGGAQFVSRFADDKPERVYGFCAYSAAWWEPPARHEASPPALIACGDEDAQRLGASLLYFKQGRVAGKPWTWVNLTGAGHGTTPEFEDFARDYFAALLDQNHQPCWVDIGTEMKLEESGKVHPSLSAWLPDESLLPAWQKLHRN